MTKTNLALLVGGACAFASMVFGFSGSAQSGSRGLLPDCPAGIGPVAWDQPPGVPPKGGTRPKRIQQVVWDQPPGVPPKGGTRPKGTA